MLNELEAEEVNATGLKRNETKSQQDLTRSGKKEPRESVLKSLLKRTHSAPKKLNGPKVQKRKPSADKELEKDLNKPTLGELAPYQEIRCCHPFVEKLKTMADKQLHKNKPKNENKSKTIKTISVPEKKKIILAEQTKIIRLKESPKAERKNIPAYIEKRDSEDILEILDLDESPTETRKRREGNRRGDSEEEHLFVVPSNVIQTSDEEPTIEELLEEEFKNDPPKKSARKSKEHIYEDIQPVDDVPAVNLHSIFVNKLQHKEIPEKKPNVEIEEEIQIEINEEVKVQDEAKVVNDVKEEKRNDDKSYEEMENKTIESTNRFIVVNVDEVNKPLEITNAELEIKVSDESFSNLLEPISKHEVTSEKTDKKVTFSQSTEEYQEKMAAERSPEKEDVALPENLIKPKSDLRWSTMK